MHVYFTDPDRAIENGRRCIGFRVEGPDYKGKTHAARPDAVAELAARRALERVKEYTQPPAA